MLEPGKTKIIDVRLNWRGTGSVPTWPLVDDQVPGNYQVKFLLFFRSDYATWYVESEAVNINIEAKPDLIKVDKTSNALAASFTNH